MVGFFLSSSVSSMTCLAATMPIVISISAQKGWKRVKFQIRGCITCPFTSGHLRVPQKRNCTQIPNLSPDTGCSLLLWKRAVSE